MTQKCQRILEEYCRTDFHETKFLTSAEKDTIRYAKGASLSAIDTKIINEIKEVRIQESE